MTTAALRRLTVLPRRSVRVRLTLRYGALFLVSGVGLLTVTYLLVRHNSGHFVLVKISLPHTDVDPQLPQPEALRSQAHAQRDRMLHALLTGSAIALAIMSVVSMALGWLMAGRVLRPLEEAYAAQRRFVANASHELRTPLAMMRTSVDVATAKPGPLPPQVGALGDKVREGLDQADRLLESFLVLARAQNGAVTAHERVRVAGLLDDAVAHLTDAAREQDIDIDIDIDIDSDVGATTVTGDPTLLARLVDNLMDNAVRHNVPGGWVRVRATEGSDATTLVVENGGAPLTDADVCALSEPFRRINGERVRSADGLGLGLSIVASIADAHGGALRLEARDEGGLRAVVTLPQPPPHAHSAPASDRRPRESRG